MASVVTTVTFEESDGNRPKLAAMEFRCSQMTE
jgi:hypothetical protein